MTEKLELAESIREYIDHWKNKAMSSRKAISSIENVLVEFELRTKDSPPPNSQQEADEHGYPIIPEHDLHTMDGQLGQDSQQGESFEDYQAREEKEYPYVVALIDPLDFDHDDTVPRAFKTWGEALSKQVEWNKSYETAVHKARKRKQGEHAKVFWGNGTGREVE